MALPGDDGISVQIPDGGGVVDGPFVLAQLGVDVEDLETLGEPGGRGGHKLVDLILEIVQPLDLALPGEPTHLGEQVSLDYLETVRHPAPGDHARIVHPPADP